MSITTKKPPIKETVGAQYICFDQMDENDGWTNKFEDEVEKTNVVKSVKVTENAEANDVYASGEVYDTDNSNSGTDIEVEVAAFPDDTLSKMRGEEASESGLTLGGGKAIRPFFAYGKAVKLKGGKKRFDWYPKCKLAENSDENATKEEKYKEQTDTIKITAYGFDDEGNTFSKITESNFPEGLTEEKWFAKPILTDADLTAALAGTTPPDDGTGANEGE